MKLLLVAIAFIAAIQQGEGNNADGWVTKDTPTCELVTWFEDAMNKAEEMECHLELQEGFPEIGLNARVCLMSAFAISKKYTEKEARENFQEYKEMEVKEMKVVAGIRDTWESVHIALKGSADLDFCDKYQDVQSLTMNKQTWDDLKAVGECLKCRCDNKSEQCPSCVPGGLTNDQKMYGVKPDCNKFKC